MTPQQIQERIQENLRAMVVIDDKRAELQREAIALLAAQLGQQGDQPRESEQRDSEPSRGGGPFGEPPLSTDELADIVFRVRRAMGVVKRKLGVMEDTQMEFGKMVALAGAAVLSGGLFMWWNGRRSAMRVRRID